MDYSPYIVLLFLFSICSANTHIQPKTPIGSCGNGRISYCSDCYTVAICPAVTTTPATTSTTSSLTSSTKPATTSASTSTSATKQDSGQRLVNNAKNSPKISEENSDNEETLQSCSSTNRCRQTPSYAICDDSSAVPSCDCPPEGLAAIPDAYDTQKYIVCVEGEGTLVECPEGEYYNPDIHDCTTDIITFPPTTTITTTTPLPSQCGDETELLKVNCTFYEICLPGSDPIVVQCPTGEMFTGDQSNPCVPYKPFSCEDYAGPVFVSDTTNCSLGHLCLDGQEEGQVIICDEGQSFNNDTKGCVDDPTGEFCSAIEDCGVCPDASTRFPIDCFSYYQCTEGTGDLPYEPIEKNCPDGTFYDPDSGSCSQTPPEGCEESTES